jgi:hypothetical protein
MTCAISCTHHNRQKLSRPGVTSQTKTWSGTLGGNLGKNHALIEKNYFKALNT